MAKDRRHCVFSLQRVDDVHRGNADVEDDVNRMMDRLEQRMNDSNAGTDLNMEAADIFVVVNNGMKEAVVVVGLRA